MPKKTEQDSSTAEKILQAAIDLFATNDFTGVSIKDISRRSEVNSALISYYFGGKKQLYQKVLDICTDLFINFIDNLNKQDLDPAEKLRLYVKDVSAIEISNNTRAQLVFREITNPSGVCNDFVKSKLLKIHEFLLSIVEEGKAVGTIYPKLDASHVAFTLESIISFFCLTKHLVDEDKTYLSEVLNSYLASVIKV
ncbi:putative HTH-type transcriptional regulator YttP [bioreactor metagenome]|uniref:Putative HTH-type transcriptional regulator YttP n=1 Tax=bioreactor metagenome TaxID=1076179 RepID=A0A644VNY3_9ZZZZ|nr:TetR family transcriptional regulator [Acidaminococcaceae bacterium]